MLLTVFLWNGFATGAGYVIGNQPPDEVAAIRLVQTTLGPSDQLIVRIPPRITLGKYSAITHLVLPAPDSGDPAVLRSTGARYLLWSAAVGPAPAAGEPIGTAGPYTLYRMAP
jgi:hypothetical protein